MKKQDPNNCVDAIQEAITVSLAEWLTIDTALADQPVAIKRKVASNAFLQLAVNWEFFLSDWWLASINRDASNLIDGFDQKLRTHATDKLGLAEDQLAGKLVTLKHLNVSAVRRLLDNDGSNLAFYGLEDVKSKAGKQLADPYRTRVLTMPHTDWQVADVTRVVRNALAHQSPKSISNVNDLLDQDDLAQSLKRGQKRLDLKGIRRYVRGPDDASRMPVIHAGLSKVAEHLRVV